MHELVIIKTGHIDARFKHEVIIRVIKSRIMRCAVHEAHLGRGEVRTGFGGEKLRERNHLEDLCSDGNILLI